MVVVVIQHIRPIIHVGEVVPLVWLVLACLQIIIITIIIIHNMHIVALHMRSSNNRSIHKIIMGGIIIGIETDIEVEMVVQEEVIRRGITRDIKIEDVQDKNRAVVTIIVIEQVEEGG